jgi:hypothetical protein
MLGYQSLTNVLGNADNYCQMQPDRQITIETRMMDFRTLSGKAAATISIRAVCEMPVPRCDRTDQETLAGKSAVSRRQRRECPPLR